MMTSLCQPRLPVRSVAVAAGALWIASMGPALTPAWAAVTNDRVYLLGDEAGEDGVAGATVGSTVSIPGAGDTVDSQGPSGAFLDLDQLGGVAYASVGPSGLDRPGAEAGTVGVQFDGVDDRLQGVALNVPQEMTTLLGSYPLNYDGILARGLQLWVYPEASALGSGRQGIVMDTVAMGGVSITADGQWTQVNDGHVDDAAPQATVDVVGDRWHHVMHHVFVSGDPGAPSVVRGTGSNDLGFTGVVYVDGIAVSANNDTPAPGDSIAGNRVGVLSIGAEEVSGDGITAEFANYFAGTIDDLEMYVFGDNSALGGQNYGQFELLADNGWIANQIAETLPGGVLGPGDVDRDGNVDDDDVASFVAGWGMQKQFVGAHNTVRVGDWETWTWGDLNLDGIVDLFDWHILRTNHPSGAGLDLNALLAAAAVPEPATAAVVAIAWIGMLGSRRRSTKSRNPARRESSR